MRKTKAIRSKTVTLRSREGEGGVWVEVHAVREGAVYFRAWGHDARAAEYAMLAAERFCVERGLVRVMSPANDVHWPGAANSRRPHAA
ncbi:MAG: hypothetical protein JNK72_09985 [Myxococcales bacterium]|nr:hypothetical protein [Myxococcales bacterium]